MCKSPWTVCWHISHMATLSTVFIFSGFRSQNVDEDRKLNGCPARRRAWCRRRRRVVQHKFQRSPHTRLYIGTHTRWSRCSKQRSTSGRRRDRQDFGVCVMGFACYTHQHHPCTRPSVHPLNGLRWRAQVRCALHSIPKRNSNSPSVPGAPTCVTCRMPAKPVHVHVA